MIDHLPFGAFPGTLTGLRISQAIRVGQAAEARCHHLCGGGVADLTIEMV